MFATGAWEGTLGARPVRVCLEKAVMSDSRKTKAQLIDELRGLRARVAKAERASEGGGHAAAQSERERERAVTTLLGNLPGMAYRCSNDPNWTMELIGAGCRELTGYEPQELSGNAKIAYGELIHPEDRQPVWEAVQAALDERRSFRIEYRIRTAAGAEKWVWEQGCGVFSDGGNLVALEGYITDITDRKRAERRLQLLSSAVEQSTEGVAVVDTNGYLQYVNHAFAAMHGYDPAELQGEHLSIFHTPDQMPAVNDANRKIQEAGSFSGEIWHAHRDGTVFPTLMRNSLLRDERGGTVGMIGAITDITELKEAIRALNESEQRFRRVFEDGPLGMALVDPELRFVQVNPALCRMLGHSAEALRGMSATDITHPDHVADARRRAARLFSGQVNHFQAEERLLRKGGEYLWVNLTTALLRDETGTPICGLRMVEDISERKRTERELHEYREHLKELVRERTAELTEANRRLETELAERTRAEKALRDSEERFRAVFETAQDSIFIKNRSLEYIHVNPAMEHLFGLPASEIVGQTDEALFGPEKGAQIRATDQRVLNGAPFAGEDTKQASNVLRSFHVVKVPMRDSAGEIVGLCGIARDTTDRSRAEMALRESEARYRTLVENIVDGVAFIADGRIEYASPSLCGILGRTAETLVGRSLMNFVLPEQRQDLVERMQASLAGQTPQAATCTAVKPDGERLYVEIILSEVQRKGRPARLCVVRDVTGQRRAEEDRARLKEQVHEAQKTHAVAQVAASIAHDFSNLLAVARNGLKRLQAAALPPGDTWQTLQVIEQAVEEATSSTQSLLMFTRRMPAERMPLRVCALVEDSAQIIRHLLPPTIELRVEIRSDDPCWVNADPSQIQQVLLNLTLNARDAMPSHGTLEVTVSCVVDDTATEADAARAAEIVQLCVRDTGTGIPPSVQPRIFEPFFTTKPGGHGTGLGLATVRSIVQDHGGRIKVESEIGRGTTFRVFLPRVSSAELAAGSPEPVPAGDGRLVLLAERNRHVRRLITSTLRSWGYEVLTPEDEPASRLAFEQDRARVTLLILSADPPERSACAWLREIRAAGHCTPAVLTARAFDAEIESQLDAATLLLRKPFQMTDLGACLRDLLGDQSAKGE